MPHFIQVFNWLVLILLTARHSLAQPLPNDVSGLFIGTLYLTKIESHFQAFPLQIFTTPLLVQRLHNQVCI